MRTAYFFKFLSGPFVSFLLLFVSSGRLDYFQGWIYAGIGMIMLLLNYSFLRLDPELIQERLNPGEGVKKWDKGILGLSLFFSIGMFITAGLDSGRYHWSQEIHWSLILTGIILTASGQLLFLIAQKENRFFSSTVRIQNDRRHTVCEKGVYRFVRHPAYLGSLIQLTGFPLLFGSLWSVLPVSVLIILTVIRTRLEDRTLKDELDGYAEYSQKTQFRIIPNVW